MPELKETGIDELPDFYDLLEAEDNATGKELQRSFRRQAIRYHPDKNPTQEAATRFHLLTIALSTLTDESKRAVYDATRKQKLEARLRRQRIEGERKAWIEELEKGEQNASSKSSVPKRGVSDPEAKEAELARQGAELRAQLARSINKRRKRDVLEPVVPVVVQARSVPKTSDLFAAQDRTLKIRFRIKIEMEELRKICLRHGAVKEVVYKPTDRKTQSALVEFARLQDAYSASTAPLTTWAGLDLREVAWAYPRRQKSEEEPQSVRELDSNENKDMAAALGNASYSFKVRKRSSPVTKSQEVGGDFASSVLQKMRQRQMQIEEDRMKELNRS